MASLPPRVVLQQIAARVMIERGMTPDFSPAAQSQLAAISGPARPPAAARDLRQLPWCSIDNDESRDLDQLSVGEALADGGTRLLVAIADVASLVPRGSALDGHAEQNTTSVYTVARVYPMLPERLSTDLTSLNFEVDRAAVVVEMEFSGDGTLRRSGIYEAFVRNRARLAYNSVAAWLEENAPPPAPLAAVPGLDENIRLQERMARQLRERRHLRGALSFETIQARPAFAGDVLKDIEPVTSNRAKRLIEDLMIAANGVTAGFLATRNIASIRRVVRTPKRWDRIVELAAEHGVTLPPVADAPALQKFLRAAKAKDPLRFPELSLSVIKLIGAGEYALELPGGAGAGHFGLAVRDYAHSTAPNRRFPDLITQRLVKAALAGQPTPYTTADLDRLARHCTEQEDDAKKVERQVEKSAAALLLQGRIGETFDGLVTGASDKGTWVRLFHPPVEGKLERGPEYRKVGERLRVRLVHVDVERGFLDFRAT
ncbi:MAG TPA: RNB domain-containing ribonuclease [Opitutaceae bacterium]|nr:RNB domain-containing ribonuclease [Opitutaceae bacterium]